MTLCKEFSETSSRIDWIGARLIGPRVLANRWQVLPNYDNVRRLVLLLEDIILPVSPSFFLLLVSGLNGLYLALNLRILGLNLPLTLYPCLPQVFFEDALALFLYPCELGVVRLRAGFLSRVIILRCSRCLVGIRSH